MKNPIYIPLGITMALLALPASSQPYVWKDTSGRTIISDTPPPGNVKLEKGSTTKPQTEKTPAAPQSAGTAATPAAAQQPTKELSVAEKDMEFKKRQQESKDKADKEAKELAAAAERREACERARQAATVLESKSPMATTNEKGQRVAMDDAQRQQELERAQRTISESCN